MSHKTWLIRGAMGCILIGAGLSLTIEASHWKHQGDPLTIWASAGTLGLCVLMTGIITLITNNANKK